jgi:hypothetical protein
LFNEKLKGATMQLSLFPTMTYEIPLKAEVVMTEEEAKYAACNYLEEICLSDAVMETLEIQEVNEIRAIIAVLRG